jgi:DNA-binding NtrC family response regulator
MTAQNKHPALLLLVLNEQICKYLLNLLRDNNYSPMIMANANELVQALKKHHCGTVFVDCEAVAIYGAGIYSKIKVASQYSRIVLFGDKRHKAHREIIKEAMEIGIYACLLAPYEDWEVLTLMRHYPRPETPRKTKSQ